MRAGVCHGDGASGRVAATPEVFRVEHSHSGKPLNRLQLTHGCRYVGTCFLKCWRPGLLTLGVRVAAVQIGTHIFQTRVDHQRDHFGGRP